MNESSIELKFRYGDLEIELKGKREDVEYFLDRIFNIIIESMSSTRLERKVVSEETREKIENIPSLVIKGGEPLTDVLTKIFSSKWGKEPRSLREVIEILETYGLYYNKSTVAVSLNRLVKRGILRRIKGKDNIYRYVNIGKV